MTYPIKTDKAKPLYYLVEDSARTFPDHIVCDFMGRETRYRDLADQVNRMAAGLQNIGVKKGCHVGIFMPNCPQFMVAYFGILKAGGTVVNYSPLYAEQELINQVEDSQTDIMITLDLKALFPVIDQVARKSRLNHIIVDRFHHTLPFPKNILFRLFKSDVTVDPTDGEGYIDYQELMQNDGQPTPVDINPDQDIAVIQYTGGTTGLPKGAMLSHANIYLNVCQMSEWVKLRPGQEIMPGFLPFFHVFAMTVVMDLSLYVGAKIVILPKFDLDQAVTLMKKHKVTLFAGVPTMFTALLAHKQAPAIGMDHIRVCISGGAPLPTELAKAFKDQIGVDISEGYGLTEASPVCSFNPLDRPTRTGSIGLPMPRTEIIIVDREDPTKILSTGGKGEICIRGPQVMKGYWQRPEETAKTIIDGMLRTGDIGYQDDEGYSYIIDRDKDLILVGGFNVYPRVIEEAIYRHPAVHEVTVIGIPDDYLGEVPKAFVVLKNPNETLTAEELSHFVKSHLGKHEQPREIEFRAELPKTMIGKLSKKELVAEEKARSAETGKQVKDKS